MSLAGARRHGLVRRACRGCCPTSREPPGVPRQPHGARAGLRKPDRERHRGPQRVATTLRRTAFLRSWTHLGKATAPASNGEAGTLTLALSATKVRRQRQGFLEFSRSNRRRPSRDAPTLENKPNIGQRFWRRYRESPPLHRRSSRQRNAARPAGLSPDRWRPVSPARSRVRANRHSVRRVRRRDWHAVPAFVVRRRGSRGLAAGSFDQDATHGCRCRGEEMSAPIKARARAISD